MQQAELSRLAVQLGLDAVGAAPAEPYEETERHIRERRARGLFARMRFTMAQPEVSCHPESLLPGGALGRLRGALLLRARPRCRARRGAPSPVHVERPLRRAPHEAGAARRALGRGVPRARGREPARRPGGRLARRGGVLREEHPAHHPPPRILGRPRDGRHHRRDRAQRAARPRLRLVHALHRRLPDRGARRSRRPRLDQVPLVLEPGARCRACRVPRGDGVVRVRVRHLPGRLPLEPRHGEAPRGRRPSGGRRARRLPRRLARGGGRRPRGAVRPALLPPQRPPLPAPKRAHRRGELGRRRARPGGRALERERRRAFSASTRSGRWSGCDEPGHRAPPPHRALDLLGAAHRRPVRGGRGGLPQQWLPARLRALGLDRHGRARGRRRGHLAARAPGALTARPERAGVLRAGVRHRGRGRLRDHLLRLGTEHADPAGALPAGRGRRGPLRHRGRPRRPAPAGAVPGVRGGAACRPLRPRVQLGRRHVPSRPRNAHGPARRLARGAASERGRPWPTRGPKRRRSCATSLGGGPISSRPSTGSRALSPPRSSRRRRSTASSASSAASSSSSAWRSSSSMETKPSSWRTTGVEAEGLYPRGTARPTAGSVLEDVARESQTIVRGDMDTNPQLPGGEGTGPGRASVPRRRAARAGRPVPGDALGLPLRGRRVHVRRGRPDHDARAAGRLRRSEHAHVRSRAQCGGGASPALGAPRRLRLARLARAPCADGLGDRLRGHAPPALARARSRAARVVPRPHRAGDRPALDPDRRRTRHVTDRGGHVHLRLRRRRSRRARPRDRLDGRARPRRGEGLQRTSATRCPRCAATASASDSSSSTW